MERKSGYLASAWADLTSDEKWWQVVLVLGIANCVPVLGQVFTMGYLYDWGKEGAWGMARPLPREVGDLKRRARYGAIWLVVTLAWVVPLWIVGRILAMIPAVGPFLAFLCDLAMIVAYPVSAAAVLRGVIYERMLPGLQFGRVLKMAAHDPRGLAQVFCIALIQVLVGIAALLLVMIPAAPFIASIAGMSADAVFGVGIVPVLVLGIVTIVTALFVWLAASVCATCAMALFVRAIGYWTAQFEPGAWGSPHEPMPFEKEGKGPGSPAPAAPSASSGAEAAASAGDADAASAEGPAPGDADAPGTAETGWRSCTNAAAQDGGSRGASDGDQGSGGSAGGR